jgi:nanoRNase/pAp phosphatase (c-di-AMP/oligoRNAs hydrolase)
MKPSDNDTHTKDEFEQVVEKLKSANSILVTVSTDPTVDQFAACIGLTLVLNKVGKHANAVFSGTVPSTLAFLKPEKTLEKDTDSLRDFIIALDKSKADKLRYKVEEDVVKIFITPYRTSISEKDLEFSQGDFNVDAVVALGVQDKNHVDKAILAHGRILHDAAVISINTAKQSRLGSVNWTDARASSLCEMVADVASELDSKVFDSQNATALLTGIVAETDRYSNDKAAPHTMSVAGLLMSAGASTQLVTSELGSELKAKASPPIAGQEGGEQAAGVLDIEHPKQEESEEQEQPIKTEDLPPPPVEPIEPPQDSGSTEIKPQDTTDDTDKKPPVATKSRVMHEPPEFSGRLTANSIDEERVYSGSTDPLSNLPATPMLSRDDETSSDTLFPNSDSAGSGKSKDLPPIDDGQTLHDIEKAVDSHHLDDPPAEEGLDDARDAVLRAQATLNGQDTPPQARQDMGTTELSSNLGGDASPPESSTLDPNKKSAPPPAPPPFLPPEQ